ncbi:hypothetical protein [Burkholderia pyrrocinia]
MFQEVSGEMPDETSLARMHRVSSILNLHDNDALWSIIAVLKYYARLYEAMPERIRWAGEGSLDAARWEVDGANDTLMQQHRDALKRCKATITLAETWCRSMGGEEQGTWMDDMHGSCRLACSGAPHIHAHIGLH